VWQESKQAPTVTDAAAATTTDNSPKEKFSVATKPETLNNKICTFYFEYVD